MFGDILPLMVVLALFSALVVGNWSVRGIALFLAVPVLFCLNAAAVLESNHELLPGQILWLFPLGAVCVLLGRRRWVFIPLAIAVVALGYIAQTSQRRKAVEELAALYPFESLAKRVGRQPERVGPLHEAAAGFLTDLDGFLTEETSRATGIGGRVWALKRLHEQTAEVFAISPGFGMGRGFQGARFPDLLRQPPSRWDGSEDSPRSELPETTGHARAVAAFASPTDTGYFRNLQQVAGFRPHQFWEPPKVAPRWSLKSLELIGLIVHEEPTAYIFDGLPRMTEVARVPTRSLDEFESTGLADLRRGEILVVREVPDGLRVLGAIRAAKQCVECHGGERGDLLGAFSYTLTLQK